ncbi:hypothetical protein ACFYTU_37735 [Nonomuraea angiospora]|uniref:hypothetical protein n=1 Tax=Nonomuraea angiospora TaxID=46172 RepID=UPI003676E563
MSVLKQREVRHLPPATASDSNQESTKRFGPKRFRRVSAREFASEAKTSAKRVLAFWRAWNGLADTGIVPHAMALEPDRGVELPDAKKYPFYGERGYYRSFDARAISDERREAIKRGRPVPGPAPRPSPT